MDEFLEFLKRIGFKEKSKNLFIKTKELNCGNNVKSQVTFKLKILKKSIKSDVVIENSHVLLTNTPVYEVIVQDAVKYAYQIDSMISNKYQKLIK